MKLLLLAVTACWTAPPPAPIVPHPTACPALDALVRGFQEDLPPDLGNVAIRSCVAGQFAGRPGFFVIASLGPPEDSKSEEGWRIYRFVVDAGGKLIARGPNDGADWMTGVPVSKLRLVDLDGDHTDEILDEVGHFSGNPMSPIVMLTVWRVHGNALEPALELATSYKIDRREATDNAAPPDCTAEYKVAGRALLVGAKTTLEAPADPDAEPSGHVARDVVQARREDGSLTCLATGSYRYELVRGAFQVH